MLCTVCAIDAGELYHHGMTLAKLPCTRDASVQQQLQQQQQQHGRKKSSWFIRLHLKSHQIMQPCRAFMHDSHLLIPGWERHCQHEDDCTTTHSIHAAIP
jgi:hypothetical protein